VPDCCGECEESLEDAGADSVGFASAVAFEIELCFEGLVDRFDDLSERFKPPPGPPKTSDGGSRVKGCASSRPLPLVGLKVSKPGRLVEDRW